MVKSHPKLIIDGSRGPRICWADGYPLVRISTPGEPSELPGIEYLATKKNVFDDLDTLVFGERSSGVRDLLDWWCHELDSEGHPWVIVWGSDWDPVFFRWSENASDLMSDGNKALKYFSEQVSVAEKAKALIQWAQKLKKPCTLIIRHLTALEREEAESSAIALAKLRDSQCCDKLRIVIADTFDKIYLSTSNHSGYWRFAFVYRLPGLDAEAVQTLAERESSDWRPMHITGKSLECFMEHTGGQPRLVQTLLNRLQSVCKENHEDKLNFTIVKREADKLHSAPPGEVRLWKEDLHRLLLEHKELRHSVEIYLNKTLGPARFPPRTEERPLFISGWLKLNQSGRWGITSLIHKDLARSVLDGLER